MDLMTKISNLFELVLIGVLYLLYNFFPSLDFLRTTFHKISRQWILKKQVYKKDLVYLHATPRGQSVPALSPFVLKLETWLKMANIPYVLDDSIPLGFGPKGKIPWVVFNGQIIGDSQLIIKYLTKKFDKNLDSKYSEEQLAVGTAVRIMLEEHFFWGVRRYIFLNNEGLQRAVEEMSMPRWQSWIFTKLYARKIKRTTDAQGLTLHSDQEIEDMMLVELRTVSRIIGKKKFLLGDFLCTDDAAVFGFLASGVFGNHLKGSPYGKIIQEELPNLIDYCKRVKEAVWTDWDQMLSH